MGHNEDRLVEVMSTTTPTKNNILLIYGPESIQQKFVCRLTEFCASTHFLYIFLGHDMQAGNRQEDCFLLKLLRYFEK